MCSIIRGFGGISPTDPRSLAIARRFSLLDIRTLFHQVLHGKVSDKIQIYGLNADVSAFKHTGKILRYPCGIYDVMASTSADFGSGGWEASGWRMPHPVASHNNGDQKERKCSDPEREDMLRSMRRARAKLRRLALANEFKYFVTLTLDPKKVDSVSGEEVVKKLNAWCSNAVQRHGLRYLLVPERHKKGGIHFHGFFNDVLKVVDSGTLRPPKGGRPRKPRSNAQREEWLQNGWTVVYNLPAWTLGFTTALELYGQYPAAVAYVCKYIGKDGEKPAGRWYYSGGDLKEPAVEYVDLSPRDLMEEYGERAMVLPLPGKHMAIVNGVKE